MTLVRAILLLLWLGVAWATWRAISVMGAGVAGQFFMGDLAHPWRGQFNIDFMAHLLLVGLWLCCTAKHKWLGPLIGVATVIGGGFFTLAYLLLRSFGGDGGFGHLLLGRHYRSGGLRA